MVDSAVGLLFTDVVGSTRRWEEDPDRTGRLIARHNRVLGDAVERHAGRVVEWRGDGVFAVFPAARHAVRAAVAAQRDLFPPPPDGLGLPVRMAIHAGAVYDPAIEVYGVPANRCARLLDAGHGGQILLSGDAAASLGDEPIDLAHLGSHRLRDLADPMPIHQVLAPWLPDDSPPLRTLKAFAHNLPGTAGSFVGRERELAEIPGLLASRRIVTVCGPGGVGKTRTALQVAADSLDRYPDGVWFVSLLEAGDDLPVGEQIASALGIDSGGTPHAAAVGRALVGRTLLVIDNCEHVLADAGAFVAGALTAAPELRILATSREPLHLPGESIFQLAPLPVPGPGEPCAGPVCASVVLLEERVRDAGRPVDPAERETEIDLCRRLDGIPLAIELAAARTRHLSLKEIDGAIAAGIDVLRATVVQGDPRHDTLRSTLAWSHDLLGSDEQVLLHRLTVFRDGWFLDQAVGVCGGPPLDAATVGSAHDHLVDQSLVVRTTLADGSSRYRMLEPVRQFASEGLGGSERARLLTGLVDWLLDDARHGTWAFDPATHGATHIPDPVRKAEDAGNLVVAVDHALGLGRCEDALEILGRGGWERLYLRSGHLPRYLGWLDHCLDAVAETNPEAALAALLAGGEMALATTDSARAVELAEEAARLAARLDLDSAELDARIVIAIGLRRLGRWDESRAAFEDVIRRAGDRFPEPAVEAELWIALNIEYGERGWRHAQEVLARAAASDPPVIVPAFLHWYRALVAIDTLHLREALDACSLVEREAPEWKVMPVEACHIHATKADALAMLGRQEEAEEELERAREAARRVVGPNWATSSLPIVEANVAGYGGDGVRREGLLERAFAGSPATEPIHAAHAGLELVPPLLDRGELGRAREVLDESVRALEAIDRLDSDLRPLVGRLRAQIDWVAGEVATAMAGMAEAVPDREGVGLRSVVDWLEVAAGMLSVAGDPQVSSLYGSIDRLRRERGWVHAPSVLRRRARVFGGEPDLDRAPPIDEAVEQARAGLLAAGTGVPDGPGDAPTDVSR